MGQGESASCQRPFARNERADGEGGYQSGKRGDYSGDDPIAQEMRLLSW